MPFIHHSDSKWKKLLEAARYDLYHLPGFALIEAELLAGEALGWYFQAHGTQHLISLIRRRVASSDHYDLVSPYGYPGILSSTTIDEHEAADLLKLFHEEAAANNYISSFIRLNPLLNNWKLPKLTDDSAHEFCRQWFHGGTVSVNLQSNLETIRRAFSENHRRNLARLEKLHYKAEFNQWHLLDSFMTAYRQTMKRRAAHPYYFFPQSYFSRLHDLLGDALLFVSVSDSQNNFVAGGLFTTYNQVIQYHLGASTNEDLHLSPSKLMMDMAIRYGIENGASLLHLGGGLGGSTHDGLYRFKKGFGRQYHPYASLRLIHLPHIYEKLKRNHIDKTSVQTAYFPEYR